MDLVICLNKPSGMSSQEAVTNVKRILGIKKAGHAGTLDPMAEGVLLVCTGEATKITRFLMSYEKEYLVEMKLGEETDSYDSDGDIVAVHDASGITRDDMSSVLSSFTGLIKQVPPMYSAIKRGGVPLYKIARRGEKIDREPREVHIYSMELLEYENPRAVLRIVCSKGTYVRSIVHDLGVALSAGAHMTRLERTRIGRFHVDRSAGLSREELIKNAVTMDEALYDMQEIILTLSAHRKAKNGIPVAISEDNKVNTISSAYEDEKDYFKLKSPDGTLFAIGKKTGDEVRIERIVAAKP